MNAKKFDKFTGRIGLSCLMIVFLFLGITEDHPILALREILNSTAGFIWFGLCAIPACYAIVDRVLFGIRGDK